MALGTASGAGQGPVRNLRRSLQRGEWPTARAAERWRSERGAAIAQVWRQASTPHPRTHRQRTHGLARRGSSVLLPLSALHPAKLPAWNLQRGEGPLGFDHLTSRRRCLAFLSGRGEARRSKVALSVAQSCNEVHTKKKRSKEKRHPEVSSATHPEHLLRLEGASFLGHLDLLSPTLPFRHAGFRGQSHALPAATTAIIAIPLPLAH